MTLAQLQHTITACERCPRLVAHRERVAAVRVRRFQDQPYWGKPVPSFGDARARLLVVGLAPAAHGANRTGRAFTGDRSGAWLYGALHAYQFANQDRSEHRRDGLKLRDCYITQVLHCVPPDNKPSRDEIDNCADYMRTEIQLLKRLRVILPLGKIAFDASLRACRELALPLPTPAPKFGHGQVYPLSERLTLISSYHPSQQNTQTGRLTRDMFHRVFATVREVLG